jgi:hypothetical protein
VRLRRDLRCPDVIHAPRLPGSVRP